jgi:hypothetical protein
MEAAVGVSVPARGVAPLASVKKLAVTDMVGLAAIGMFVVLLPLVVSATWGVARLAHVYIEQPFIHVGRMVGRRLSGRGV